MQRTYQLSEIGPTRVEGELAALLTREGIRHRFTPGQLILQQGDKGDGFWLIEAGTVTACRFDPEGDVTIFGVLGPGELLGELAHFAGVPRQVDVLAECDAVLIRIDAKLVSRLLAEEPDFAMWLLKSLANQLRLAFDRIDSDRRFSAEARLTQVLIDMAARDGLELDVTQQNLADFVGISRVTAGQILGKLAKTDLVRLQYRRVLITDLGALIAHRSILSGTG